MSTRRQHPASAPLWQACAIESVPAYKMFVFGGQKAEFQYSDQARPTSES